MLFRASQVANAVDRLITSVDDLYAVLNHLTGDNLFTHQLPRAARWARPLLVEQCPWLPEFLDHLGAFPWNDSSAEERRAAAAEFAAAIDAEQGLVDLTAQPGLWVHFHPIEELVAMAEGKPVVVVEAGA